MKKALIGAGGHAREVESYLNEEIIFFVDEKYLEPLNPKMLPLDSFDPEKYEVIIRALPKQLSLVVNLLLVCHFKENFFR